MSSTILMFRWTAFLLLASVAASPALAVDGVIEINAARAAVGGVTAGDAPGYPVTISERGSYVLTGILEVQDTNAIDVTAEDVSIDLNGYGIQCLTTCSSGTGIESVASGIRIRNGFVRGMGGDGILVAQRARLEDIDASNNGGAGIAANSGCIGMHLRAEGNGGRGILCPNLVRGSAATSNGLDGVHVINGVAVANRSLANGTAPLGINGNGLRISGGVAAQNTIGMNGLSGIRTQQPTAILANSIDNNTSNGIFAEGAGDLGYWGNTIDANAAGTVNCTIGAVCIELGGNLCGGTGVCP